MGGRSVRTLGRIVGDAVALAARGQDATAGLSRQRMAYGNNRRVRERRVVRAGRPRVAVRVTMPDVTETSEKAMPDRLLTAEEAFAMLGLPESSGYAALKNGLIPRPIKIGRRSRWSCRGLQAWICEQFAATQPQNGR